MKMVSHLQIVPLMIGGVLGKISCIACRYWAILINAYGKLQLLVCPDGPFKFHVGSPDIVQ